MNNKAGSAPHHLGMLADEWGSPQVGLHLQHGAFFTAKEV